MDCVSMSGPFFLSQSHIGMPVLIGIYRVIVLLRADVVCLVRMFCTRPEKARDKRTNDGLRVDVGSFFFVAKPYRHACINRNLSSDRLIACRCWVFLSKKHIALPVLIGIHREVSLITIFVKIGGEGSFFIAKSYQHVCIDWSGTAF